MVECFACGGEMNEAAGCDPGRTFTINGTEYDPIPYGDGYHFDPEVVGEENTEATGRCHDCGTTPGEYHHPGCDMEECPECGGQYFICDCVTDEKVEIWGPAE